MIRWLPTSLALLSLLSVPHTKQPVHAHAGEANRVEALLAPTAPVSGYACVVDIQPVGVMPPIPAGSAWNIQGDPPPDDPSTRSFHFIVGYAGTTLGQVPLSSTVGSSYTVKIEDITSATPSVSILDGSGNVVTGPGGQAPTFTKWQTTSESPLPGFAFFATPVSATSRSVRLYAVLNGSGIAIDYAAATAPPSVEGDHQVKFSLDPSGSLLSMPRAQLAFDLSGSGTSGSPRVDVKGGSALEVAGSALAAGETLQLTATNLGAGSSGSPGLTARNLTTGKIEAVSLNGSSTSQGWVSDFCVVVQVGAAADTAVVHLLEGERAVSFEVSES